MAYRSGALADMAAITGLVHEAGALVLWDLCHAVGAVPVELDDGGRRPGRRLHLQVPQRRPGAPAFLYVRRELQDQLRQPIWGWFGQADQFAMGPAYEPAPGIGRFLTGTPHDHRHGRGAGGHEAARRGGHRPAAGQGHRADQLLIALADEWLAPLGFDRGLPARPGAAAARTSASRTRTPGGSARP